MRSRLVSLLLAASMCLTLGGCGGLSGLMGGIIIEPSGHSDGESHTPDLNYSGAQGSELCVEVYSLEEGDWSGPAPALSLPVSGSGSVRLSFDLMAERVSASVSDGEGERPASADMGEPPARPDTAEQIVYITDTKHVAHGETVPVVAQYFGGGSAPQLESFGQPEALEDCEAVYILTVRFE